MLKNPLRAFAFLFFGSLVAYGAATIPAGAYKFGEDIVTAALILTVNSLS
jgi:hypothetical protein